MYRNQAGPPSLVLIHLQPSTSARQNCNFFVYAVFRLLLETGQRGAAVAQYAYCAELLRKELDIAPPAALTALIKHELPSPPALRQPDVVPPPRAGLPAMVKPPVQRPGHNLPAPHDQLEWARFQDRLGRCRAAMETVAAALRHAQSYGDRWAEGMGHVVLAILRDKPLLLILDNCAVVLDGLGFMPGRLTRVPGIVVLATSREPLNFGAEAVVLLDGLPTDEATTGAAEIKAAEALFAERGQMARADIVVSAANLPQVRQICRLVDGLPLGIALAAAWVRRRSLAQISQTIGQSLDFLSTGLRDVEPRHRSMRAVLATSWQLLDATEQAVLAALAIFPANFSAAAASVAPATALAALDLLCEKFLLQQQHEAERYSLHSLVRQFAAEKLAARSTAGVRAFVDYFYKVARAHQADYGALQPESANVAAAITKAHALEGVMDFPNFDGMSILNG